MSRIEVSLHICAHHRHEYGGTHVGIAIPPPTTSVAHLSHNADKDPTARLGMNDASLAPSMASTLENGAPKVAPNPWKGTPAPPLSCIMLLDEWTSNEAQSQAEPHEVAPCSSSRPARSGISFDRQGMEQDDGTGRMAVFDEDEGFCACCMRARFRTQILLVSLLYLTVFALSLAAIAAASVSDEAIGFAIVVAIVSPSIHFLFSLIGMFNPANVRRMAQLDAFGLVLISEWALAGALATASTSCALQGLVNDPAQRPVALVANALVLGGQLGWCAPPQGMFKFAPTLFQLVSPTHTPQHDAHTDTPAKTNPPASPRPSNSATRVAGTPTMAQNSTIRASEARTCVLRPGAIVRLASTAGALEVWLPARVRVRARAPTITGRASASLANHATCVSN